MIASFASKYKTFVRVALGLGLWLGIGSLFGMRAESAPVSAATSSVLHPALMGQEEARFFVLSDSCKRCHDASPNAEALWSPTGEDASPYGTWQASVMANAFRDPYWRAQVERELSLATEESHDVIRELCTRCHAPAAIHENRLGGLPSPTLAELEVDPAAHEGVTCTVCHRVTPEGLGTEATFHGNLPMDLATNLYGPYPDPFDGPMAAMSGYQVKFGAHMVESSLCATCHTLETGHGSAKFLEQSPYLEWRNSIYTHEQGITETSQSCQACHMPVMGDMRLAHNPGGRDFPFLFERPEVRSHAIVGGNSFLLDMLRMGREALGVRASAEELQSMADLTRDQLSQATASVELGNLGWARDNLKFDVLVENLAGHKLPSGYPSRRAWLEVTVRSGENMWFESGVPDGEGRIVPRGQAFGFAHVDQVTSPQQVQVYELVAVDSEGKTTTQLSAMEKPIKDNRLLPRGWKADGPHAEATKPVGLGEDKDFDGGRDIVHFDLAIPEEWQHAGRPMITARLLFQTIPPGWADDHRGSDGPASKQFLELYDAVPTRYEVLAETRRLAR